jgi:two-component system sensor histidine kinase/response regulator
MIIGADHANSEKGDNVIETRASLLFKESYHQLAVRNDRMFACLLAFEWLAGIIVALCISPRTYSGVQSAIHVHLYAAIFLGFATISLPIVLIRRAPGTSITRHAIAAAQMIMSGLMIDLTGGRIETHFLIFGSLAFLAFYRDWRVLAIASLITAGDHFFRGVVVPRSIYGSDVISPWRWLEHTGYVVFEDIFLISSCLFGAKERQSMSMRQAEMEVAEARLQQTQNELEIRVEARTSELSASNASLNQEVADRTRSECALKRAEELLSGVMKSSLDGIMAFESVRNESGQIENFRWLLTNPAAERLVGKTHTELSGRLMLDLFPGNKTEGLFDAYVNVVELGRPLHVEQFYAHDGLELWLEISAVKLGDGFSVTVADITTRKCAEKQLKEAKDAAEMATKAKSEFLANMSHEIRTPITAMVGFADMMLDPDQTQSDRADGLQTIRRNAKHLLDVINEILDLSKIEAGRMTVENILTDLPPLLSDVLSIMRPRAVERGVELKLRFSGKVPRKVLTDPVRAKQILMNLVGNALKFTERGQVEIRVSADPAGEALSFEVTDTGIGISEEQIGKLFRPFTQADGSTTRRFGGTGLGLTISRHLAQMLGGDISVRSVVGVGSTFTAKIAGADDGSGECCRLEDALTVPQTGTGQIFETINGKVLLAEDGKDNQRFISAMLRKAGVEVVIAENGRVAVQKALSERFDLILMDMQMPELDGYAATSRLRGRGFLGPIIALTANAMADDRAKCIQAGCTDYLSKPIDRNLLIRTVARYVRETQTIRETVASQLPQTPSGLNEIVSTFDGDPVMTEVLMEFIANLPNEVASLKSLLCEQNLSALRDAVHQLKGAGGSYGFQTVTNMAAIAERSLISNAPIETVRLQVDSLIELIGQIRGFNPSVGVANER